MRGIDYSTLIKFQLAANIRNNTISLGNGPKFIYTALEKNSGVCLQKHLEELKKSMGELELRKRLSEIKFVSINNTFINSLFISTLNQMFPNFEDLEIDDCVIREDCNLGTIKANKIDIRDSVIENITSLNLSQSDLGLLRCNINKLGNTFINSRKITIDECNIDYYKLFLKSNFPNLETLFIKTCFTYDGYTNKGEDLKNSFIYLPYSCPNIKKLRIEAKVDDLDFLVRLTKLEKVSILSTHEELLGESLEINDLEKLKKMEEKNHINVEIQKIIYGVNSKLEESSYITRSEMDRIIKLNRFFRKLSFTEKEKEALRDFNFGNNYLNYVLNNEIDEIKGYYENYYDELVYEENDTLEIIDTTPYKLVYKYGCVYYDRDKNIIVKPQKAIFYIDGIPIILRKVTKPVLTIENAKEITKDRKKEPEGYDPTLEYIEKISEYAKERRTPITVNEFVANIKEYGVIDLDIIYKDVLDRLEGDKTIIYKLLKYNKMWDYIYHIRHVRKRCLHLFSKMLSEKINLFTKEEMIVIISKFPYNYDFEKQMWNYYCNDDLASEEIINSINEKCDYKYIDLLTSINALEKIDKKLLYEDNSELLTDEDLEKISNFKIRKRKL